MRSICGWGYILSQWFCFRMSHRYFAYRPIWPWISRIHIRDSYARQGLTISHWTTYVDILSWSYITRKDSESWRVGLDFRRAPGSIPWNGGHWTAFESFLPRYMNSFQSPYAANNCYVLLVRIRVYVDKQNSESIADALSTTESQCNPNNSNCIWIIKHEPSIPVISSRLRLQIWSDAEVLSPAENITVVSCPLSRQSIRLGWDILVNPRRHWLMPERSTFPKKQEAFTYCSSNRTVIIIAFHGLTLYIHPRVHIWHCLNITCWKLPNR